MYCIIFRFTASARDQQVGERAASNDGDRIFVVIGTEFICFSLLLHQIIAVPTITIYLGPSFNCQWIFVFVCGFVAPRVTLSCGCDFVVFCVCWPWQRSVIVQFIQRPTMHKFTVCVGTSHCSACRFQLMQFPAIKSNKKKCMLLVVVVFFLYSVDCLFVIDVHFLLVFFRGERT